MVFALFTELTYNHNEILNFQSAFNTVKPLYTQTWYLSRTFFKNFRNMCLKGLEPLTTRLKVECSSNWATGTRWSWGGLNSWLPACKAGTLPTELQPQNSPSRAWTCDTMVNSHVLCQLSYRRIKRPRWDLNPQSSLWQSDEITITPLGQNGLDRIRTCEAIWQQIYSLPPLANLDTNPYDDRCGTWTQHYSLERAMS